MNSPDPEKLRAHTRRMAARRKFRVLAAYSEGEPICACCGENHLEFLGIDHIEGGGNKHRKEAGTGGAFYRYLVQHGFPPGYRVLCHNCNLALGFFGYCPHTDPQRALARAEMLKPRKIGRPIRQQAIGEIAEELQGALSGESPQQERLF